jgi:hypothetical protein
MATKKRGAPKVAEAAPTYTPRSRVQSGKTDRKQGAQGEALWQVFLSLPEDERGAFIEKMLENRERREDMTDIWVVIQRRGEPTTPYEEFEEELKREGRL